MTTLASEIRTARRPHRCGSCGRPILAGDRYHFWRGTGDLWDGIQSVKECGECCRRYGRPIECQRCGGCGWLADAPEAPQYDCPNCDGTGQSSASHRGDAP